MAYTEEILNEMWRKSKEKKLYTIEGYRIWAHSHEEALEHLEIIKRI